MANPGSCRASPGGVAECSVERDGRNGVAGFAEAMGIAALNPSYGTPTAPWYMRRMG